MMILAIDTSSVTATVALAEDQKLLGEMTFNDPKTHSQKLMPMVEHLFQQLNVKVKDVDLIIASTGPGSFTGIRIGLSSVKAMAQVHKIPLVLVSTLDMLAYNAFVVEGLVCPLIDAKKKDVFYGLYTFSGGQIVAGEKDQISPVEDLIESLKKREEKGPLFFVGDGALKYQGLLEDAFEKRCYFLPYNQALPKAGGLIRYYEANKENLAEVDYKHVHANYLRKSQAELDLIKKQKKQEALKCQS